MPAWVRWILAAFGAAAVTSGLFVAMPGLVRIGDPEPGRALIAWQGSAVEPENPFLADLYMCFCTPVPGPSFDWWPFDFETELRPAKFFEPRASLPEAQPSIQLAELPRFRPDFPEPETVSAHPDLSCVHNHMRANYPAAALERELEGNVVVLYDLSEDGRAVNARLSSASHPIFAEHVAQQIANCGVDAEPASRDQSFHLEYRLDL